MPQEGILLSIYKLCILNAIGYAPHILLMTSEVNESQFPKFLFQFIWHWSHNNTFKRKLFCRIPFFTIPWDLSRGYKTKVITLPPKISTITSNEEKNVDMSMEMLNSFNTCSSWLCYVAVCNNYANCNKLQTALNCNAVCNTSQTAFRVLKNSDKRSM